MLRGKDYQPFFHLAAANLQIIIELCKENLLKMQTGFSRTVSERLEYFCHQSLRVTFLSLRSET